MTYPKRGEISDDGKFYTHTDGSLYEREVIDMFSCTGCAFCGDETKELLPCKLCNQDVWLKVRHAQNVPSAEEQEACDMAREMIVECCTWMWGTVAANDCGPCAKFEDKSCPARAYLAAHGDSNAWETNG